MGMAEGILLTIITAATPLLLASLGELVAERSGVLNLGVEGMMAVGAVCGFAVAFETGYPALGVVTAIVAGAVTSVLFSVVTLIFVANQVASGLALTLFGLGLSGLIGEALCRPAWRRAPQYPHPRPLRPADRRKDHLRPRPDLLSCRGARDRGLAVPLPQSRADWCSARSATTTPPPTPSATA